MVASFLTGAVRSVSRYSKDYIIHQSKANPAIIAGTLMTVVGTCLWAFPRLQHALGMDNEVPHTVFHHKIKYGSAQYLRPLTDREYCILFNNGRPREGAERRQMFPALADGWEARPFLQE